MKLVIVESPAKAKTIEKYLKELGDDFVVRASVGHVRDLPKSNKNAIDIEHGFKPRYEILKEKEEVVKELKKLAAKADEVYLATDPDREGEAIAWHLAQILNLENPKRVEYHEITKDAIKQAFSNPRTIDIKRKTAQEARRVLDRLFGYELSGLLWKKLSYNLSAGRVQSPALRILMEKEREIKAFIPETYFELTACAQKIDQSAPENSAKFGIKNAKKITDKQIAEQALKALKNHQWQIQQIKQTKALRNPKAPFITSSLQQEASNRLGYSPAQTMRIAQKLYEKGYITYMRTDSPTLSKQAQAQIAQFINQEFGDKYLDLKQYKSKSKQAQEAHEAIRPSDIFKTNLGDSPQEQKLYNLIWTRAVSSQMKPAQLLRTKVTIKDENEPTTPEFEARGSVVVFDGWLRLDKASRLDDEILPELKEHEPVKITNPKLQEKQTQPPSRYTEAGLVKELEKRGIGRPSTYATIIKTLKDRGYVRKEGRTLIPTDIGDVVSNFLEKNFAKYIADEFTAQMENELDEIAIGKKDYEKVLEDFWFPFKQEVGSKKDSEKLTNLGPAPEKFKCPECGGPMIYKLSKTGKFMSCAKFPECQGARKADGSLIQPPKETGESCPKCGAPLVEKEGRFGKFIACSAYPKCKYIKPSQEEQEKQKTGVQCPSCKKGEIVQKRGRFGIFYACENYPECKFTMKAKPTGNICPECGSLMMEGTKTIPERCSNKSCPNHRPDKSNKSG